MNKRIAQNLINKTKDDYNKIASHFASTRKKGIWPDNLESLKLMNLQPKTSVLDIGSGSGRLYPHLSQLDLKYTGIDLSDELVKYSQKEYKSGNFLVGDATNLPFGYNEFDNSVSVAVFYHIPSKELRQKAIKEAYRVIKSGGRFYISVWYFWNKPDDVKRILLESLKIFFRKSDLEYGDFLRPWKSSDGKLQANRYCHAWTLFSLKRALKKAGFKNFQVIKGYKKGTRNLNIVCEK